MKSNVHPRTSRPAASLGVALLIALGTAACAHSTAPSTTVELSDFEQVPDDAMGVLKEPENKIYRSEEALAEAKEAVAAAEAEIDLADKELNAAKADKTAAEAEAKAAKANEDKGRLSAAEGKIKEAEDAIDRAKAHVKYAKALHDAEDDLVDLREAELAQARAELELARVRLLDDQKVDAADKYAVIEFTEQVTKAEEKTVAAQADYDDSATEAKDAKGVWEKLK